jgi:hypothetical protein
MMRTAALVIITCMLASCSAAPKAPDGVPEPSPEARLQAIPAADPAKYGHAPNYKTWRNPYLIIRSDGVALLDLQNNEEHIFRAEEVAETLAKLPPSAWPYGRVVAVAENATRGTGDDVLIRKNRGIVLGTLESMRVVVSIGPPFG